MVETGLHTFQVELVRDKVTSITRAIADGVLSRLQSFCNPDKLKKIGVPQDTRRTQVPCPWADIKQSARVRLLASPPFLPEDSNGPRNLLARDCRLGKLHGPFRRPRVRTRAPKDGELQMR